MANMKGKVMLTFKTISIQILLSGQIVVAGKVDRELLPWLNFTVRLILLILDVRCSIVVFSCPEQLNR